MNGCKTPEEREVIDEMSIVAETKQFYRLATPDPADVSHDLEVGQMLAHGRDRQVDT
jgi:hypothetical protein